MKRVAVALSLIPLACQPGDPENSFACGIEAMAGPAMVYEQFGVPGRVLAEVPEGVEGLIPARVVGYRSARALSGAGPSGIILGYEGDGFPRVPGFGLLLVEDSLETFKGVLIFETEAPQGLPQLGTISSANSTLPVFGLRVTWAAVSSERCPLIAPLDTSSGR